ncbi:MAG TPA: preprotein translocase subunit SecE [Patescibacteria group bacterium]|jgi:preprotein translocase subunit SecE|nr:preprotein translocase subunit SecE [Patescibacteria group bacterium]
MATTPVVFLKEVRDELGKVVWPTRDEIIRLTGVVILISVIVGIFLGTTDFILTKLVGLLIARR